MATVPMSARELNLRIFRREPVNRILWQPRIERWYNVNKEEGTLPERYGAMTLLEVFDDLGCSPRPYWAFNPAVCIEPIEEFPSEECVEGDTLTLTQHTPVGDLVTVSERTAAAHHTRKYPVDTPGDMKAMEWILRNQRVRFDMDVYIRGLEEIGDRAAPSICIPRINMMRIVIEYMGFENALTAGYVYPDEYAHLVRTINETDTQLLDVLAACPVELFNFSDNVHQNLCPPPIFEQYVMPEYIRRNELLHKAGKKTYAHLDGECKQLLPYVRECGFDGYEAITPVPQGDVTLEEIRDALGDLIVVDGIPRTDFLRTTPIESLVAHTHKCIDYFAPNLVLGISDEISPIGDIERVRMVSEIRAERSGES